jgi:phage tail-like protein
MASDLFSAFNFSVEITIGEQAPACGAAFSECDGLELNQEVRTIREGGNNGVQVRLAGPTTYGTLTLKRGMTASFDLWDWFERVQTDPSLRAHAEVVVLAQPSRAPDRTPERVRFVLQGCRPLKLKAPALSAKDGTVAIEELQVAYESLTLQRPAGGRNA